MNNMTFPSRQIGAFSITAISDGYLSTGLDSLSNIDLRDASTLQQDAGVKDPSSIHINCYLVRGRGRTILIDAGAGGFKQWGGKLKANLALAGVQPCDIDTILLTHAHPDHVGGLVDPSGEAAFPDAELVVHQHEVSFWEDDSNLSRASERARGNFLFARKVFDKYRERIHTFTDNEVRPGISAIPLLGHTAGHSGYRLESDSSSLLIWGDIVHFPHIQIARPDVSIAFDQDPLVSAETRSKLLDAVSSDKTLIAGMHLGELGFARIERAGKSYKIAYES
ncbi:beta-lactamase domain-containing protein [Serratia sp. AS12]|uniref:MBL fold metallo-hydrolase n=1 Tax=Serratia TaxID=613 RepID=UPI00020E9339|nr:MULTISPECIES: MBL fold metallo-hydrolase [Serratia]AEF45089.1 beta-lactamase domain-containing protein [Serratia plymuthica AS9]AEF50040.1 beta-lactamase domain-containing protein [Serratia sp. AS12]AEG27747.1 beta-lactamase domain-containing protein [Serratia sp. AS13]UTN98575.1 MBL fold metallo-hydrolase [Serratia plymuthica]